MGSQKMASTTPHVYHSLDQTVQELAGKIVVKRRDNESARQVQLDAIEINEDVIGSLRERVKVRRRDLAHMLNKDKEVTENALADPKHRFQRLQCKRYDADTAKQELNEDLCNEIKRMNRVKYQKECRRKRLADLLLKLHDYCLLQETNYEEMELRRLKTEEDKMIMKRNTAKYIHSTYTKSLRQLTKTRTNVQNDLDTLHLELKKQSAELLDLKQIQQKTTIVRDQKRANVASLASEFSVKKIAQDRLISQTAKKMRQTAAEVPLALQPRGYDENQIMSTIMAKQRRKSMAASMGLLRETEREKSTHDMIGATMKEIQGVTSTASPIDIPATYQREMAKFKMLMTTALDINKVRDEKSKKYSETQSRLNEVKYKQKQECEQLEAEIARLKHACNERERNVKILDNHSAKQYENVVRAIEAINSIKEKFNPSKVNQSNNGEGSKLTMKEALNALKEIEQSIIHHSDDIGEAAPTRRTVCYADDVSNNDQAVSERLWDRNYDDKIFLSPMKRVLFDAEMEENNMNGTVEQVNFDEQHDEHFVSRASILALSKPKGRRTRAANIINSIAKP